MGRQRSKRWMLVALASSVALVAGACTGGGDEEETTTPPATSGQTTNAPQAGGTVTLGVEQWPQCLNPITCGAPSSVWWSVLEHVLPMAMVPDVDGNLVASPVLTEAPTLENGGITEDPFTVTFHLNPEANWSDGSPITSADIEFTWRAIMNTTGAYSTTGYDLIESIDTSDPKTAVVSFSSVYTAWPQLFGGYQWGILQAAAFPDFAADPAPDLKDEMQDNIPFSGGPWILDSWSNQEAVLVRNPDYYGTVPLLDQLTMVPFDNTNTEIQSLISGQVDAIQPQVGNASVIDQIGGAPGIQIQGGDALLYEAIVFNHSSPPLDDPKVREALMYAVDRQALVDALVKINNPEAEVLNCGAVSFPKSGPWCQQTQPYSQFTYDPAKSVEILESAGYDCSGVADGPCTKDGEPLVLRFSTTVEDTRRTSGQELIKERMKGTGFDIEIDNYEAAVLFTDVVPTGEYTLTEYGRGSLDPSVTSFLACESIPSEENGFSGGNWSWWCNEEATELMHQADQELDVDTRVDLMSQVYDLGAQDFLMLPLYVLPVITAWRSDRIGGPVGVYTSSLLGMYANANEWFLVES